MDNMDGLHMIYQVREAEYFEIIGPNLTLPDIAHKGLPRSCQFTIPKFIKEFPNLGLAAFEAQIDLVKDKDVNVRKFSVKYLPEFCKVNTNYVPEVAETLTKMLLTEDLIERKIVNAALINVMEIDVKATLQVILSQISIPNEKANVPYKSKSRKCAIDFLNNLKPDLLTEEIEEFVLESCKRILPKVSCQDFLSLIRLLSHLKIANSIPAQNAIVDIIASQLDIDADFVISADNITVFFELLKQARPFFSKFVSSKKFVYYISHKIFPLLGDIKNLENWSALSLYTFHTLANISAYLQKDDTVAESIEIVYKELLKFIPPPESVTKTLTLTLKIYFTHIEALLYSFIQLLKHEEMIISVDNDRFNDLINRLKFLSSIISCFFKHLNDSKTSVVSEEFSAMERTLTNLDTLVNFVRSPLLWNSNITFSACDTSIKRPYEASTSFGNTFPKRGKGDMYEMHVPCKLSLTKNRSTF